ncbi:uncharacterized protein N7459_000083 [Penicillium hispanicum]|uniref:uncharacterized protein n=1 Tax=Penicillium hispanicum TaxID=1080232 RepID=UPI002541C7C0|nr:uncharacterized protein N7459_000083 [Penicillium hispanicum]KAJ5593875.1 hypothetical protein N7459_000083 [Penicillium hispanicum]
MPLFKKSKSPSNPSTPSRYSVRSAEQLAPSAFTDPSAVANSNAIANIHGGHANPHNSDRRASYFRVAYEEPPGFATQTHTQLQTQPEPVPVPSSLYRSQSQRQPPHLQPRDRPTAALAPEDPQPRRSKKSLFVRPASGILERSVSVKGKPISHPLSQPTSPGLHHSFGAEQEQHLQQDHPEELSPVSTNPYEPHAPPIVYQQSPQQLRRASRQAPPPYTAEDPEWSPPQPQPIQFPSQGQQPRPLPLEHVNTDPTSLEQYSRSSPTEPAPESPRYAPEQGYRGQPHSRAQQDLVLNARPPSQHSYEPRSPVPSQQIPDAMQQSPAQAPQPQNQPPSNEQPPQDSGRRGSTTQAMPEPGRQTPTGNRARDEPADVDIRALIQKHDELQSKYSKVKRYYFEKEAQVQHLQNTVAHQRMAVSRTVLDDNEYTNRFQRLDGAIKDLAFSVRKDWRGIPTWLNGLVTEDAVAIGTKEMTAVGRAVVSRWLVDEVFNRYFHPGLDPNLSLQLKSIEMNLRRQQMCPATDEDRENAIARLSNWRRTTFDGLGDTLAAPAAQEYRGDLIEQLTAELVLFLSNQLHEPALPGLDAGVRMIVENTINITEKIPLEARDVCVEYLPPNILFHEAYMKVEGGLPPLTHQPPPPADQEHEDPAEDDSSPGSNSTGGGGDGAPPAPREARKKTSSVFGALIGRKPAGPEPSRPAAGQSHDDKPEPTELTRIRFASFLAVEVRGKGPSTVLMKAPVWLIEWP